MAEAIVNHRMGDAWEAFSAGTRPADAVHPMTTQVLREIGIDHTGRVKSVNEFKDAALDLVVTVCDPAAEDCPVWLGKGRREHLDFPDPVNAAGTAEEQLEAFRSTRDAIVTQIPELLKSTVFSISAKG